MNAVKTLVFLCVLGLPLGAHADEQKVSKTAAEPAKITHEERSRLEGDLGAALACEKSERELEKNLDSEFEEYCKKKDVKPAGCTYVRSENVELCQNDLGEPTYPPTAGTPEWIRAQGGIWTCTATAHVCGDCVYDCPPDAVFEAGILDML